MRVILYGLTTLKKKMKEKVCRHLLPGIEQIWEKITLEKYEGGLPASVGAEREPAAKLASALPGVPTFAI